MRTRGIEFLATKWEARRQRALDARLDELDRGYRKALGLRPSEAAAYDSLKAEQRKWIEEDVSQLFKRPSDNEFRHVLAALRRAKRLERFYASAPSTSTVADLQKFGVFKDLFPGESPDAERFEGLRADPRDWARVGEGDKATLQKLREHQESRLLKPDADWAELERIGWRLPFSQLNSVAQYVLTHTSGDSDSNSLKSFYEQKGWMTYDHWFEAVTKAEEERDKAAASKQAAIDQQFKSINLSDVSPEQIAELRKLKPEEGQLPVAEVVYSDEGEFGVALRLPRMLPERVDLPQKKDSEDQRVMLVLERGTKRVAEEAVYRGEPGLKYKTVPNYQAVRHPMGSLMAFYPEKALGPLGQKIGARQAGRSKVEGLKTAENVLTFALNVVPVGGTVLEIHDKGFTFDAAVYLATDIGTALIPGSKAALEAGKISAKTAGRLMKLGIVLKVAAGTTQLVRATHEVMDKETRWSGAGKFLDALLILAGTKGDIAGARAKVLQEMEEIAKLRLKTKDIAKELLHEQKTAPPRGEDPRVRTEGEGHGPKTETPVAVKPTPGEIRKPKPNTLRIQRIPLSHRCRRSPRRSIG